MFPFYPLVRLAKFIEGLIFFILDFKEPRIIKPRIILQVRSEWVIYLKATI